MWLQRPLIQKAWRDKQKSPKEGWSRSYTNIVVEFESSYTLKSHP